MEYYDAKLAEVALNKLNNTKIGLRPIKIEFSNKTKEGATVNADMNSYSSASKNKRPQKHYSRGRSRSYESGKSNEKHSVRSDMKNDSEADERVVSSESIRKQYLSDFFSSEDFHDRTPAIGEMALFLSKTLDMAHSTVISTTRLDNAITRRDYESRRRERAQEGYNDDRERISRKGNFAGYGSE